MPGELKSYRGSCHCGAVQYELQTTLSSAIRCNCSICRRKGVPMASVEPEHFRLIRGEDQLTLYQFNTRAAKHYFCKVCGSYTFHRPRSNPNLYRVNTGCLEGVDPLALQVKVNDGASLSTVTS